MCFLFSTSSLYPKLSALNGSSVYFWYPSQHQQPQNHQQLLLKYITQYLGFSGRKPIAASLIYYCLLHWRSFEEAKTTVFDSIIQIVNSATEVCSTFLSFLISLCCSGTPVAHTLQPAPCNSIRYSFMHPVFQYL